MLSRWANLKLGGAKMLLEGLKGDFGAPNVAPQILRQTHMQIETVPSLILTWKDSQQLSLYFAYKRGCLFIIEQPVSSEPFHILNWRVSN